MVNGSSVRRTSSANAKEYNIIILHARNISTAGKYTLPAKNVYTPSSDTPRLVAARNVRATTKYTSILARTSSSAPVQLYQ